MLVSKVNDACQGFCAACECFMTGKIVMGASTVLINKLPAANMNSIVQGNCGHIGYLISSSKNLAEKLPIGKIGDFFQGTFTGYVVTGASDVWSK